MVGRFDQSRLISEQMILEQLTYISNHTNAGRANASFQLTVFNSSQDKVDGVYEAIVTLPQGTDAAVKFPLYGGTSFKIYDHNHIEVPYQLLEVKKNHVELNRPYGDIPGGKACDMYRIAMKGIIPAVGYASCYIETWKMKGPDHGEYSADEMSPPVRYSGSMQINEHTWDNGSIKVCVNPNGTVDMSDHKTGQTFEGLLLFEDEADIGDGWNHISPVTNETFTSRGANAVVSVVSDGPLLTRIRIRTEMRVPGGIQSGETKRADSLIPLEIVTELELRKLDPIVRCRTVVKNNVRDHRLRVLFPTGLLTDRYKTSTAFDLVERLVKQPDYSAYLEKFSGVVPHNGIIAVEDNQAGLAVYSKGLYETVVRDNCRRIIAMTLFRSTQNVVGTNGSDGGQLLQDLEFDYAIRPFNPGVAGTSFLLRELQQFTAGIRFTQHEIGKVSYETQQRRTADLPAVKSFMSLDTQDLIVSSVKESEDRPGHCVIRLFNVESHTVKGALSFDRPILSAKRLDLNETVLSDMEFTNHQVTVEAAPKQIVTVEICFSA